MTEPTYFIVERGAGGRETAAVYYGILPERLTRKAARDPAGRVLELPAIVYALRLDRLAEDDEWRTRSLDENYGAYLMAVEYGERLPPSNLVDPPLPQPPRKAVYGESYKPPVWHWDWQTPAPGGTPAKGAENEDQAQ